MKNYRNDLHGGIESRWSPSVRSEWFGGEQERDGDSINFRDDANDANVSANGSAPPWVVLVVDDDQDVHDSTRIALDGERVIGRQLKLLHAYSAGQARQLLASKAEIAVLLLDVVMETDDAGLRLALEIRDDTDRRDVRIIIRTGQPGYATDSRIVGHREIDGYLTKARLTRAMLLEAIADALAPGSRETDTSRTRG